MLDTPTVRFHLLPPAGLFAGEHGLVDFNASPEPPRQLARRTEPWQPQPLERALDGHHNKQGWPLGHADTDSSTEEGPAA